MNVQIIDSPDGLAALRGEWTDLLEASPAQGLFLSWEWLSTWWAHLSGGRRLRIFAVRSASELVALAPLALRPRRLMGFFPYPTLEFLGTGSVGSDYLDVIVRRGREDDAAKALAPALARENAVLVLDHMQPGAAAARMAARLGRSGWAVSASGVDVCPYIPLAGMSFESYLASLSPSHRYNFRRRLRFLEKHHDVRFELVREEAERGPALDALLDLHARRWLDRGGSAAFHTPGLVAFHREFSRTALERGWLRLFLLKLDGRPAAALYAFRYGRTFYFYQSGFDAQDGQRSVGLVAMGLAIKSALEEGAEEYDLLHGNEAYKFHWAPSVRSLCRLEMYPARAGALLCRRATEVTRAAKRVARRVLPESWAGRIAASRRALWGDA